MNTPITTGLLHGYEEVFVCYKNTGHKKHDLRIQRIREYRHADHHHDHIGLFLESAVQREGC